jgi:hypothetical protein
MNVDPTTAPEHSYRSVVSEAHSGGVNSQTYRFSMGESPFVLPLKASERFINES